MRSPGMDEFRDFYFHPFLSWAIIAPNESEVPATKALTYLEHGKFPLMDKPVILDPRDAVVRVTLGSICTSDLHIKHGSVPRAVPGITVGHEMVGVVEP